MKRSISLFFILIANIVILAHAVLPHSYDDFDNTELCNIYAHKLLSKTNQCPHNDNQIISKSNNENNGSKSNNENNGSKIIFEDCQIEHIYISYNKGNSNTYYNEFNFNLKTIYLSAVFAELLSPKTELTEKIFKPYITRIYKYITTIVKALRAPPTY